MFIIYFSTNYVFFLVGYAVIGFFFAHDIQIIYILEEAPDKFRAMIYSVLKSLGIFGVVCIPMLRNALMGNDPTQWRKIFLVPAIAGLIGAVLVVVFAKDTKVFINDRIAYLSTPYEVRQEEKKRLKEEKKAQRNQSGVFNAVKYIFSRKDTKLLIIAHIIFDAGMPAIALYYESSMHIAGMSTEDITKSMFVLPIVYAVLTLFSGFVADLIGRKKTIIIGLIAFMAAFVLYLATRSDIIVWAVLVIGGFANMLITVNTLPLVLEIGGNDRVGTFTGYYYTATFSAQIASPIVYGAVRMLSGTYMSLFVYSPIMFVLSMLCIFVVKHGEALPDEVLKAAEAEGND